MDVTDADRVEELAEIASTTNEMLLQDYVIAHAKTPEEKLYYLNEALELIRGGERFDLILAMDWDNLALLEERCPPALRHKLGRLTDHCSRHDSPVVPDPYAGGAQGFEEVLDLVEDACDGLVLLIRRQATRA